MRTIIAGSRGIIDLKHVQRAMNACGWVPTVVISGDALGVDKLGEVWALMNGIPVEKYPVTTEEWKAIGKAAGTLRNLKMADRAEACVAIWDGSSPGTSHMIHTAYNRGLRLFLLNVDTGELAHDAQAKAAVPGRFKKR
jgi:hypothetical protein